MNRVYCVDNQQLYKYIKNVLLQFRLSLMKKKNMSTIEIKIDDTYNDTKRSSRSPKLAYPPLHLKTSNEIAICAKCLIPR